MTSGKTSPVPKEESGAKNINKQTRKRKVVK